MGVKVSNNAFGTLSAGISTSDTTITLDSGQGARFPTLGAGDYFFGTIVDTSNNLEIVKVTARSSDSMTVVRGQDDTTATAFAIGDRFELRPTAALFEDIIENANVDGITSNSTSGTAMTISSSNDVEFSNDVGIGESSPDSNLHITNSSGASARLEGPTSGDIASGVYLYSGTTLESSWYVNPTHDTTFLSRSAFNIRTNNAQRMKIDSSGRVSMPDQTAFHAYGTGNNVNADLSGGTIVQFATELFDRGGVYNTSNGRFTAPIDGVYLFGWTSIGNNSNDVYRMYLLINGSTPYNNDTHLRLDTNDTGSAYATNGMFVIPLELDANDYVQIRVGSDGGNSYYGSSSATNEYWRFWGHLIG